jgi:hypothetical protein
VTALPLTPTVFFFARLGDVVMITRMLNLLHRRYGRPCQVIGTGSWTSGTYDGNPGVADVWAFHRHLPFLLDPAWGPVRRALRATPAVACFSSTARSGARFRRRGARGAIRSRTAAPLVAAQPLGVR